MKTTFALIFLVSSTIISLAAQKDTIRYISLFEAKSIHVDSVIALKIAGKKYTAIPKEIGLYKNLQYLDLSRNKLTELPDFFENFKQLKVLKLGKNKFSNLPSVICKINSLKRLELSQNKYLTHISECIVNLENLNEIDFWDTPLAAFPDAFLRMNHLLYIDMRGVVYGPIYQQKWIKRMPWTKIEFDTPCECMEK